MKSLPLLGLLCTLAAASAAADQNAAWSADYARGPWDEIGFADPNGKQVHLWVNLRDAGKMSSERLHWYSLESTNYWAGFKDQGEAPLYRFQEPPKKIGNALTFDSSATPYRLDLVGGGAAKVILTGRKGWSAPAYDIPQAMAQGDYIAANPPTGAFVPTPGPSTSATMTLTRQEAIQQLEVVEVSKQDVANETIRRVCPSPELLTVRRADIPPPSFGDISAIQLYCAKLSSKNAHLTPIPADELPLTALGRRPLPDQYQLDRGRQNNTVTFRPLVATDFSPATPPSPHKPKPHPRPAPTSGGTVDQYLGLPDMMQPYLKDKWPAYKALRDRYEKIIAANASPAAVKAAHEKLDQANAEALQDVRIQQKTLTAGQVAGIHGALSRGWAKFWNQLCLPYEEQSTGISPASSTPGGGEIDNGQGALRGAQHTAASAGAAARSAASVPSFQADRNTQLGVACIPGAAQPKPQPAPSGTSSNVPAPNTGNTQTNGTGQDGSSGDLVVQGSPSGNPGTSSSKGPAAHDPNFQSHVIAGIGGAMIGLLFGTLFGPAGVLVGGALGFGVGFGIDKHFNG